LPNIALGFPYRYGTRDTTLVYLTTTRIGDKCKLTIPKQFRRGLGLRSGAPFAVFRWGNGLILFPEQQRFEQLCAQVSASLTAAGLMPVGLVATLPETRNRVFARYYRKTATRVASK
jgi:AbrB family looped-hinge helix DNA binding protein